MKTGMHDPNSDDADGAGDDAATSQMERPADRHRTASSRSDRKLKQHTTHVKCDCNNKNEWGTININAHSNTLGRATRNPYRLCDY